MLKFEKDFTETHPAYRVCLYEPDDTEPTVVAKIQQRDSWCAPTTRKRWTILVGTGFHAVLEYTDTLKDAKASVINTLVVGFRTRVNQELARKAVASSRTEGK